VKARFVAGDPELGAAVEKIAARHAWEGAPLDERATAVEIGRLRARMERELAREAKDRFHVKAGRGGLLDVEFLVQYLQLIHGRGPGREALRARATHEALDALARAAILDEHDHRQLAASYRFLRRVEARLRIVHDRPIAEVGLDDKLARRLGYHGAAAGARLLDDYREHSSAVRRIYARFLPT
jgi:glutamate-ammonia-ligase adenylyltransferase